MAGKMTRLAASHGDEVVVGAFKKVGPRAGRVASEAGEHGGIALKIMAKHGDGPLCLLLARSHSARSHGMAMMPLPR